MTIARINGIDIYFELHGDKGDPLFFVHGYTGDITDWRHQLPVFSKANRVLIMDNRGHGKSEAPNDRGTYTVHQMVEDALALATEVGFDRFHLLGHSMGGAIAQEIAVNHGGRLLSLTLEDTAYAFDFARNEMFAKFTAARHSVAETQGMAALAKMKSPFPSPPFLTEERQAEVAERLSRQSVDAFIGAHAGLTGWTGTLERLATLVMPTMLIYGDLDMPFIEPMKQMSKAIPGAVLEVVSQAGHSPQYERPEIFNAALERHLDRSQAASAK